MRGWNDFALSQVMFIRITWIHFEIGFDFFHRNGLKHFNIVLISSTESRVVELIVVFQVWIELFNGIEDVLVEG